MTDKNSKSASAVPQEIVVLLIEDHVSTAKLIASRLMVQIQCKTVFVHTLAQARQILGQPHAFSVIICDLNLPDACHEAVVDAIKPYGLPMIALTAEVSETLRDTIIRKGVVDYVLKNSPAAFQYLGDLILRVCKNGRTKVLVVDDSSASRQLLTLYLEQQNLQVLIAKNGVAALEVLADHPDIRLVMADYEMPLLDGVSLVFEVRKTMKKDELAIIGISGSTEDKLSARFLKNGANDFIHKPYVYEEILCRVNQNLEMLDLLGQSKNAAIRDFLTGLYNRRHFFSVGEKILHSSYKKPVQIALAMIDIDHFKRVNDGFGHEWGDIALQMTATNIEKHFSTDLPCRIGGEEFVVLFLNKSFDAVQESLESFRRFQEQNPLMHPGGSAIQVCVSIGLAEWRNDNRGHDLNELVKAADDCLYLAKQRGRNQLVVA